MTLMYTIDEGDFLAHQLYVASQSTRIKRKRKRNKIIVPIVYIVFGFLFFLDENISLAVFFACFGVIWFFVYPIWERGHYVKHYRSFIAENYKARFGRTATLHFSKEYILANDSGSESKILTTEVQEIIELPTIILVRLKDGQSFIIPKDRILNMASVRSVLKELAAHLNIKYIIKDNWKWN